MVFMLTSPPIGSTSWGADVNTNWTTITSAFTVAAPFTGTVAISPPVVAGSAPPVGLSYTGPAHTSVPSGTEVTDIDFNIARTVQWAGGTQFNGNRFVRLRQSTIAATSASTFASPATLTIDGAPIAGTNATLTSPYALVVVTGQSRLNGPLQVTSTGQVVNFTQLATSNGIQTAMNVVGGTLANQTASTEVIDVFFNLARTVSHATGALASNRAMVVSAPTYAFVGASTLTNAATFAISGAPVAGTNATLTNSYSLWLQAGTSRFDGDVSLGEGINIALGTTSGTKIGTAAGQKLGFFNATPVVQPSGTGATTGFTAGAGTTATSASTFTGNLGATAYGVSDVIKALKNYGLLAQ